MCKYAKGFLLCLLSSTFLYSITSSGACKESFELQKLSKQLKVFAIQKEDNLSIQEAKELIDHLENNVFLVLKRATTNEDVNVRQSALKGINRLGGQLIQLVERGLIYSDIEVRRETLTLAFGLLYEVLMTNIGKFRNDLNVEVQNQVKQDSIFLLNNLLPLIDTVLGIPDDKKLNKSAVHLRAHALALRYTVN